MADWDIKIVADTNDADYVTEVSTISDEDLTALRPLIVAIAAFQPYSVEAKGLKRTHRHNFPDGEYAPRADLGEKGVHELYGHVVSEDVLELFRELTPSGECGIHSITSIHVAPKITWEQLL